MSDYGEPRNGDFASYVESLSRQGKPGAPGQVPKARRGKAAKIFSTLTPDGQLAQGLPPDEFNPAAPAPQSAAQPGEAAPARPAPVSMAERGNGLRTAAVLTIAALVALFAALSMLLQALGQRFDPDNFVPVGFLVIVALMLLKGARQTRAQANKAPAPRFEKLKVRKRDQA